MKRYIRTTLRVLAALLVVGLLVGGWFHVQIIVPHRKFYRNDEWWATASTNDIRELCHHIIGHRPGGRHDPFIHLCRIGNAESVPLLIAALEWENPHGEESVICTISHCEEALRALTGKDLGTTHPPWARWWNETGRLLPPEQFYPRDTELKNSQPAN